MKFSLWDIVKDRCPKIKVVDIGAMDSNDENCPCRKLLRINACEIIGFEPDEKECEKLNQSGNGRFLPYIIGDGDRHIFRICNQSMTSSLYEPNTALLEKFQYLEELTRVIKRQEVSTKRLDDIEQLKNADYLKIDTQGAEFEILSGAKELLKDVVAVHTEVIFLPLYIDQPRFAQVDSLLQDNGFLFHNFYGAGGRVFKPLVVDKNYSKPLNQILWADAIYIRNFMDYGSMPPQKLLKLAVILHEIYGSYDLVNYALTEYDKQSKTGLSNQYLQLL